MPEIIIIDRPGLKSFLRRTTELGFTTLIWGFWLYFLLPLLNIVLWLLGMRCFYVEVIEKAGHMHLLNLLTRIGVWTVAVFGILRLWGYYNYRRFGKKDRRRSVSSPTHQQLSELFQVPVEQIVELQSKKEAVWPIEPDLHEDVNEFS